MINLAQETEALALRLAEARRLPVEEAIRQALEERARTAGISMTERRQNDRSPAAVAHRRARMDPIIAEIAAMPVLDRRSPHEIADDLNVP